MEIIILENRQQAAEQGARIIAGLVRNKPECTLGLATGQTPIGLYGELIRMHREENLDFSKVTSFNLDEYVGLSPDHPSSYNHFMQSHLFRHLNIPRHRIHIPDGLTPDIPMHCRQYEAAIAAAGGIDLQVLGIGTDGHIGFNEPSSSLTSRTRIKTLTRQTISDNAEFFVDGESVPHHVITMGIGTIMESRTILMLAFGSRKARAVSLTVEGPITSMVPASVLQNHPRAILIVDEPAAVELSRADYYRWVFDHKPQWQKI